MNHSMTARAKTQSEKQKRLTVKMNYTGKILAKRAKLGMDWFEFRELVNSITHKTKLHLLEENELHAVNMVLAHRLEEAFPSPGVSDAQAAEILGL